MADLQLLQLQTAEAASSPELSYLAATGRTAARRIFGHVEEAFWHPGAPAPSLARDIPLLLFAAENIHLGPASLALMKETLAAGAGIVVPRRLSDFELPRPIHTLRGFETVEKLLVQQAAPSPAAPSSHLPVALIAPRHLDALSRLPVARLFEDPELLAALELCGEARHAGIYHDSLAYSGEAREDVLPFIPENAAEVLEVGCGRGVTGRLLEERRGCRVTGVELNPEVAVVAAKNLSRVIVGDIERLDPASIEGGFGPFDAVVATELFEHLQYPERFLARVRDLLVPGGRIVLSVPNVGHYSIVEDLLAGRWDYLPIGLLCYTHFRFFTRATLEDWIARVGGFASHEIVAQKSELPERFDTLPEGFQTDRENLATTGFYVVLTV